MSGSVDFKIPLKVPLEALSYRFRKLQKHLSKEVESEIKNIKALKDNFSEEECAAIRNRLEHLRSLTLTSDIGEKEYIAKMQSRARVAAEQSLTAEDKTVLLVADYLLRLREFDCVERIVAEYGGGGWLEQHLDIAEHREAHAVEEAVSSGDLTTALNWCQSHASKLRRVNSVLEFYLAQEQFLDFVYENNPQEALQFAQSHLAGLINAGTDPKTPVKTNPHVAGDTSKAKSDDKRLRSSSMGTYPSRPVDGMTSSAKSGTVAVAPAAIPSFDQFGANSNTAAGAINSSAFTQVDGDTELKNELRHLTGLLVYPSTSPEVINHPRYAPSLRHARLQSILELFRTDFRKVYGFPEVSPLETYLTTGIAVLKTPTCTASFLNGCELRSPSEDDISPSTSADRSIPSSRRNRGSVVGAALNRLLAGVDNRGAWTDNALSSEGQQRSNGRFFSGFSNIGGFLNISSRRTRSQSMSAVEETFQRVGTVAGIHGSSGSGNNMDILVAVARRQCDQTDGARAHSSATSNAQSMDLADDNGDQTSPHVMPEHPCYHPSRQHTACEAKEIKLSGGKRRAEECPVCSFEGGVGPDLACAVPSFNSPVSVLVCRGSGVVMSHENPPMALPNGQVFSRNFLLATAIKQEAPVKVSTPTASASRDTSVYRRELSSPVGYRFTNSARASTQAHARGASEREESRWSVLRSLAARSVARDISNSRHSAARSAQHSIAEQATLDVSRTQPTSAPRPNVSVGPAIDTTSSQAAAVQQASAHVVLTRGADGILRSRSDAAVAIAAPLLQVSPIRHDIQQDSSPVQVHRAPSSSTPHTSLMEDGSDSNDSVEEEDEMDEDIEEEEEEEEDRYSDNAEEEEYMEEVDEEQQEEEEEEEEEINLRTAVNNWRERRSAAEPSYRQDETRMDTSSGRRSSQERSSSDSSADNNLPMETVLMAVCPITGDRFEFSKLRTVFLA